MIGRTLTLLYGIACYSVGMATLGYTALWLVDLVPNALDAQRQGSVVSACLINTALVVFFGLQHSGMARPAFKRWWTQHIPAAAERSTYLLATALAMGVLFAAWQPIGIDLWRIESGPAYLTILAGYAAGWAVLVSATFFINHFDLMGLRQVWLHWRCQPYTELPFVVRGLYRVVRHPIYLGWFMVVWITPVMTVAHLLFAVATTSYIFLALRWEERDLQAALPEYQQYRQTVPGVIPGRVVSAARSA